MTQKESSTMDKNTRKELMNAQLDVHRASRTGLDEAIFALDKSPEDLADIIVYGIENDFRLLFTRLSSAKYAKLPSKVSTALDYDSLSETAFLGKHLVDNSAQKICILTGGTSDLLIARESLRTLEFSGYVGKIIADIGVAGLWRLQERLEEIKKYSIIIVVAGMEASLATVLSGLVPSCIIAVPTSNGYGVAEGGKAALFSLLTSCGQGIMVVNIDNGYGAACGAIRMINSFNLKNQIF